MKGSISLLSIVIALILLIQPVYATEIGVFTGDSFRYEYKLLDLIDIDFDISFPFYQDSPSTMPAEYEFTMRIFDATIQESDEEMCEIIQVEFESDSISSPEPMDYCLDQWDDYMIVDTNWTKWIQYHEGEQERYLSWNENNIYDITNIQEEFNIFVKYHDSKLLADEGDFVTLGYYTESTTWNYDKDTGVLNDFRYTIEYEAEVSYEESFRIQYLITRVEGLFSQLTLNPFLIYCSILILTILAKARYNQRL